MQSPIFSIVFIFAIILSVQTRSLQSVELDLEMSRQDVRASPRYFNLLTLLKNRKRKANLHPNVNDDRSSSNNHNTDDTLSYKTEELNIGNRRFFLFPTGQTSRRNRLGHSYGRKAHWDTFFG